MALAGLAGTEVAVAKNKNGKKKCAQCKEKVKGKCKPVEDGTLCEPSGSCQNGKCVTCTDDSCGPEAPICGSDGVCRPCGANGDCSGKNLGTLCCGGRCRTGNCRSGSDCSGTKPICQNHSCVPCSGSGQCPSPKVCEASKGTCCDAEGAACSTGNLAACCSGTCDTLGGGTCGSCHGLFCNASFPCCGGHSCSNSRCDGCLQRGTVCNGSLPCCNSNCSGGVCLSASGGRCVHDADGTTCYKNNSRYGGACVGGTCRV